MCLSLGVKGTVWLGKGNGESPDVKDSIPRSKGSDEQTPSHGMYRHLFIHWAPAVCLVFITGNRWLGDLSFCRESGCTPLQAQASQIYTPYRKLSKILVLAYLHHHLLGPPAQSPVLPPLPWNPLVKPFTSAAIYLPFQPPILAL